jgi:hypothetical protein
MVRVVKSRIVHEWTRSVARSAVTILNRVSLELFLAHFEAALTAVERALASLLNDAAAAKGSDTSHQTA